MKTQTPKKAKLTTFYFTQYRSYYIGYFIWLAK